ARPDHARHVEPDRARLPGAAAVLRARLRHLHPLPRPLREDAAGDGSGEGRRMTMAQAIIVSIIVASTPLLLAALGELVAERSGVLNLGVEGMMIMGAVAGFIGTFETGHPVFGILAAILAGMLAASL